MRRVRKRRGEREERRNGERGKHRLGKKRWEGERVRKGERKEKDSDKMIVDWKAGIPSGGKSRKTVVFLEIHLHYR